MSVRSRQSMLLVTVRRSLCLGDSGAVMFVFAMCGSMMLIMLSWSLIMIETAIVKSRVQSAMDVANLSLLQDVSNHYASTTGTSLMQINADAQAYFRANLETGFWDSLIPSVTLSVNITGAPGANLTIQMSANATVNLISPINLTSSSGSSSGSGTTNNIDAINFTVTDTSTVVPNGMLELALVLDNTGSMQDSIGGQVKMTGLKNAANYLISNVLSSTGTNRIGLVPFTTTVNVKNALPAGGNWMSQSYYSYDTTNVKPPVNTSVGAWGGCTAEPRDSSLQMYPKAYSPLDAMKFSRYFYNVPPSNLTINTPLFGALSCLIPFPSSVITNVPATLAAAIQLNGFANYCAQSDNIGEGIATSFSTSSAGNAVALYQDTGCISTPVTFLTNDSASLTASVNSMTANGSTVIPVGILWGWRMLSSSWSNALSNNNGWVSTDPTYPLPEATNNLKRVMIVITDGENNPGASYGLPNTFYFNGLTGVGRSTIPAPTVYRSDGSSLGNGARVGSMAWLNGTSYSPDVNTFQLAVCTAAKSAGIQIYAITFGAVSSIGNSIMQQCASPNDFYNAPDGAALLSIFQQIAANLGVARLTQ